MVIAELKGGLGNQLFQYGAAKTFADAEGVELFFDIQHFQSIGAWKLEIDKLFKLQYRRKPEDCYELVEDGLHFQDLILPGKDKPTFLSGYFQSYKYHALLKSHMQEVICGFALHENLRGICSKISSMKTLGIHVRRGDYLNKSALSYHGIIPDELYSNKINEINERESYDLVVGFSDSHETLKRIEDCINLPMLNISAFNLSNIHELQIMTFVNDLIIANSSFSWWGARLNINEDRVVYRPKNWFNDASLVSKDLCPKDWLIY